MRFVLAPFFGLQIQWLFMEKPGFFCSEPVPDQSWIRNIPAIAILNCCCLARYPDRTGKAALLQSFGTSFTPTILFQRRNTDCTPYVAEVVGLLRIEPLAQPVQIIKTTYSTKTFNNVT